MDQWDPYSRSLFIAALLLAWLVAYKWFGLI